MNHHTLLITTLALSLVAPNLSRAQIKEREYIALPPSARASADGVRQLSVAAMDEASLSGKPGGAALVVPKDAADAKQIATTEEDLNIMARILAKAAAGAGDHSHSAMGIAVRSSMFGAGGAPQNLYLEGYGALFFLNVNYPLVAPPAKRTESAPKEVTSSEWEEARRELYQPRVPGLAFDWPNSTSFFGEAEPYDADKVAQLKTDLITALRDAVHIRTLKPDETVTLVVTGRSGKGAVKTVRENYSGGGGGHAVAVITNQQGDGQKAKLILRAKRSDIEALQKDKIGLDDFRKRVTIMVQ